jgi:hypothetical protein
MNRNSEVATTIKSQLYIMDRNLMMALGASDFSASETETGDPCLLFRTRGVKHKGWVQISLNGMDTYDIKLFTLRTTVIKIKKEIKDIYVDMLPNILEEYCY